MRSGTVGHCSEKLVIRCATYRINQSISINLSSLSRNKIKFRNVSTHMWSGIADDCSVGDCGERLTIRRQVLHGTVRLLLLLLLLLKGQHTNNTMSVFRTAWCEPPVLSHSCNSSSLLRTDSFLHRTSTKRGTYKRWSHSQINVWRCCVWRCCVCVAFIR